MDAEYTAHSLLLKYSTRETVKPLEPLIGLQHSSGEEHTHLCAEHRAARDDDQRTRLPVCLPPYLSLKLKEEVEEGEKHYTSFGAKSFFIFFFSQLLSAWLRL